MVGKTRRLKRIFKDNRSVIVPMDHGVTALEDGLENIDDLISKISDFIDAIIVHKGIVKHSKVIPKLEAGLIIHLSGSTSLSVDPNDKRILASVEKAISLGADAVSVHVNIGSKSENRQIEELGKISEICDYYGIPLLAMMYPRGENIVTNTETVSHAARVGYELGADVVKVPYVENFSQVVKYCKIPIVVAGGGRISEIELFERVRKAITQGASGIAVGRNVFGSKDPRKTARELYQIVHNLEVIKHEGNLVI